MEEKKEKNKAVELIKTYFLPVICIVVALIVLIVGYFVLPSSADKREEQAQAKEYTAVFDSAEQSGNGYLITLENYDCKLVVITRTVISEEDLNAIAKGTEIWFRIDNQIENPLTTPELEAVPVYTLKTAEKDIVTLDSYHKIAEQEILRIRFAAIVFTVVILGIGVYAFIRIKQTERIRRERELAEQNYR